MSNNGMVFDCRENGNHVHTCSVGGKALNLYQLTALGFRVPPFMVVSADAFRQQLLSLPGLSKCVEDLGRVVAAPLDELISKIQSLILDAEFPTQLSRDIEHQFQNSMPADSLVAVRSSASDEDGANFSFAGMHDSFLFVKDITEVQHCIKKVWASAFNARAIAYRRENGLDVTKIAVAVVVQQMIDASTSGVVFTVNPANDRTSELVISSLYGAGEGLVSAGLAADTYTIKKQRLDFESDVVEKTEKLVFDQQQRSGLACVAVEAALATASSLTDEQIRSVASVSLKIENAYRRPQDIEFCFDGSGKLFVLQARPITKVKEYGPAAGNRLVWDNSNIIESYSGVTSPMTFSFIRRAYTIVYHCFAEVMGIPARKVHDSRLVFENMLGLFRGRVYYNLQNWYRLIRLFPGFQYNSQFMESMMGLKEPLILDDPQPETGFWRKWFVELPALMRLVGRGTINFLRIRSITDEFQSNFRQHYDRWDKLEFDHLAPHELKALYHQMEDAILWKWKAPIINDFYVMIYFGLLKKLCLRWCHDQTGALQNDLVCGEGGVESAEPAKMLLRLASIANLDSDLCQQIYSEPIEEVPQRVKNNPNFSSFNQLMQTYLDLYGFRCMNELKLEEFSLRDRPHVVYQVLRNYLSLDNDAVLDVDAMSKHEQAIRAAAEQRAFESIRGFHLLPRKIIFRRVLRNARLGIKNRENMRFARTRIYGLFREMLRALGDRLAEEKILNDREDIFYLTIDEVWDYVKGTAVTTRLLELTDLRRSEFGEYHRIPPPDDRFETHGFAYHLNLFRNETAEQLVVEDGKLRGIGCCPGELTNVVRVVRSPSDNLALSGEILVAERTDPGWVPLYPAVSGILIERGSILSHSAVVAREMGIPTIVGVTGLLKHISDGDTVTMNGSSGVVDLEIKQ